MAISAAIKAKIVSRVGARINHSHETSEVVFSTKTTYTERSLSVGTANTIFEYINATDDLNPWKGLEPQQFGVINDSKSATLSFTYHIIYGAGTVAVTTYLPPGAIFMAPIKILSTGTGQIALFSSSEEDTPIRLFLVA